MNGRISNTLAIPNLKERRLKKSLFKIQIINLLKKIKKKQGKKTFVIMKAYSLLSVFPVIISQQAGLGGEVPKSLWKRNLTLYQRSRFFFGTKIDL